MKLEMLCLQFMYLTICGKLNVVTHFLVSVRPSKCWFSEFEMPAYFDEKEN